MPKSAYQIEHKRSELAAQGRLSELRQLYSAKYPEIKDENSSHFWNERLEGRQPLRMQDGMTRDRTKLAARFLPPWAKYVLDIGIGSGWVEELIEGRDVKLYGNDISDIAIKQIKQRFKGHFTVESIYNLHYDRYSFDAVFLLEVLEHIPPSKTFKVLADIRKLLKIGGYLILSVPTNEGLETMADNPNGHVRMYTVPLIRAELQVAGFKVRELKTLYAFKNHYTLKKLLAGLWPNRWKPNNIVLVAQEWDYDFVLTDYKKEDASASRG